MSNTAVWARKLSYNAGEIAVTQNEIISNQLVEQEATEIRSKMAATVDISGLNTFLLELFAHVVVVTKSEKQIDT